MSKARDIADLDFNSPDIDGGNIDGATIGGTTPAAGSFSGLTVDGGATTTFKAGGFTANSVTVLELAENRDGSNNLHYGFKLKTDGAGDNNFHLSRHSNSTTGNKALSVGRDTGDISFYEGTGASPKMVWSASNQKLTIDGNGTTVTNLSTAISQAVLELNGNSQAGSEALYFGAKGGTGASYLQTSNGNGTAGNYPLLLNPYGGNLAIGTDSPQSIVHIDQGASGDAQLTLETHATGDSKLVFSQGQTAGNWAIGYDDGGGVPDNSFSFAYKADGYPSLSGQKKMILTSAGDLLVGTTTNLPAINNVQGIALSSGSYGGRLEASRTGGAPVCFNRLENGSVLEIKKSGVTSGIIGATGSQSYIHGGGTDVGIYFGSNNLYPYRQAGLNDATIDLGQASKRFKDLYLSGGIHLGGTGNANILDDYEEGDFTLVISGTTTAGTNSGGSVGGRYTKIGRQVTCQIMIANTTVSGASGSLKLSGLPFTPSGYANRGFKGTVATYKQNLQDHANNYFGPVLDVGHGTTDIYLLQTRDDSNWAYAQVENQAGLYIEGTITYFTT